MAGVGGLLLCIAAEPDLQPPAEGYGDPQEDVNIKGGLVALDPADDVTADPGSSGEVSLGPSPAPSRGPDVTRDQCWLPFDPSMCAT